MKKRLINGFIIPTTIFTFCCSQKIPAVPSPCCCRWSCPLSHGYDSRSHGFHCHAIQSRSHWTCCSSFPHPPQGEGESACSCTCCVVSQQDPDHCCRCPLKAGQGQAQLGCSLPPNAAVPWSCSQRHRWRWMLCTPRFHPGPLAPGSNRVWSLNPWTSVAALSWTRSKLVSRKEKHHPIFTGVTP